MDKLDDLITFLRVADAGGFSAAACAQGVGVSRRSQASGAHRVAIRRKGVVFTA
ncbi:MAG: hypothetical protein GTN84_16790 [Hydrogenophaga sp.]|uniref:hypothetical protein n=1 Tax=Hydrogenophaga sp. TaxID=1904254 RepID=UPI0016A7F405|nr:hypothetical protein [Hydrogenophaga sp.]NIM42237.1 hypothetical protein [Hydrogenophaga sp.]NIN27969.1 hypothetical protein [Hydrogenophaga sp.]NIN32747.1 hypothetical protein [Hydrogenophaga sp.]NIN54636.1 hypothetical protein [Hydrogenophaga sp.]NIO51312.1 hypothetical protein [Hydrogenophaga sp.]